MLTLATLALGMALHLPPSIIWRGNRWHILTTTHAIYEPGDRDPYVGLTDCDARTITIDLRQPPSEVRETLQHELMHVITSCSDATISWHNAIRTLSEGLDELKHTNPALKPLLP